MGKLPKHTVEPLTEATIQKRLNHFFASWKYNVDGLFVFSWESDKLLWTKAGYIYEFEIKISRADFRNDFKHKQAKHLILASTKFKECQEPILQMLFEERKKKWHEISDEEIRRSFCDPERITRNKRLPNYFYYAVPEGLIEPEEVPAYAGLLWLAKDYKYGGGIIRKKEAPCLHKTKYTDGELNLGEKFYYNWKSALHKVEKEKEYADLYKHRLDEELAAQGHDRTWAQLEKELKMAKSDAEDYKERWGEALRNSILENAECKRLRHAILQIDPNFDLTAIKDEVEKIYYNYGKEK